jgi:hypothetical protein
MRRHNAQIWDAGLVNGEGLALQDRHVNGLHQRGAHACRAGQVR